MYVPKSKILESQFTNGKEFIIESSKKLYIGYYHSISDREFFTGKTPDFGGKQKLKKLVVKKPSYEGEKIYTDDFTPPAPFYPQPTEDDYKVGFMTRYFMKRRTDDYTKVTEISPIDYNKNFKFTSGAIDTNIYVAVKINWKISGPLYNNFQDPHFPKPGIIETNKKLVKIKEQVIPGLSLFITDYSKFSKDETK